MNSRGEKQFATDFKLILPAMTENPRRMYLECIAPDNRSSLADSSFQFLYRDTLTRLGYNPKLLDSTLVHFFVNNGGCEYYGHDRRGVRDLRGRSNQLVRVIPAESPGYYSKPPEELGYLATFSFRQYY